MISNKKSYTMKMLQLALALSLLHVDPDNYLQQHLHNWDSQLELRDGDGWELEMLRAVPMIEYPYVNRKTMMPLIDDLVSFDSIVRDGHPSPYNITAYLLNISNESSNETAAMQEMQTLPPGGTVNAAVASNNLPSSSPPSTLLESNSAPVVTFAGNTNNTYLDIDFPSLEMQGFHSSEQLQDQRTVWEQNLADLSDFNDLPIMPSPYANLPLKEGQQADLYDLHLEAFLPSFSSFGIESEVTDGAVALNDSFPHPDNGAAIKLEQIDGDDDIDKIWLMGVVDIKKEQTPSKTSVRTDEHSEDVLSVKNEIVEVKQEPIDDVDVNGDEDKEEVINVDKEVNPFHSRHVEFTKEESELVEVLWKQDVDLGYTLNQEEQSLTTLSSSTAPTDDDLEKLKALEELKFNNSEYDAKDENNDNQLDDDWAGIPFTIDNETGEYIRLPLDEILNDVLQFAELAGDDDEVNNSNVASTSAAGSAISNSKIDKALPTTQSHLTSNKQIRQQRNHKKLLDPATITNSSLRKNCESEGERNDLGLGHTTATTYNRNDQNKRENNKKRIGEGDNNYDDNEDSNLTQSDVDCLGSPLFDLDDEAKEELAGLDMMLHSSAPFAPHHHPHPHAHPHAHHPHHHHHHPHHHRTGGAGPTQNYGGVNSAFHRQPSTSVGFHHASHQGRMPLRSGVSMEQRLQDIANLFNPLPSVSVGVVGGVPEISPYHYPTHPYSYQSAPGQHVQYAPPPPPPPPPHHSHHHAAMLHHSNTSLGDLCSTQPHYGHNLGSAVSSSMHLTNSTHDNDMVGAAVGAGQVGAYKMEHDMMYYSNASSDINHTTDGFINSILNDEDLHLMDMNVNESFCRMVDVSNSTSNNSSVLGLTNHAHIATVSGSHASSGGLAMSDNNANIAAAGVGPRVGMTGELMVAGPSGTTDRLDASSDSAVSSMGSERVSSLSDGEWGEGSDSAQDYHPGKYGGPYDYSYNNGGNNNNRQPSVAQKKHQMFGKRFVNEQPPSNTNGLSSGPSSIHQVPTQSIKYEYESYPPMGVPSLTQSLDTTIDINAMAPVVGKNHNLYSNGGGAYSIDFSIRTPRTPQEIIQHNHTYSLPPNASSLPRSQMRDKKNSLSSNKSSTSSGGISVHNDSNSGSEDDIYMTRDEKRARAMNIQIPVSDIINLPMDEFNERLSKYDLSENQLSLIRDIRRRGKNKVAAQNCRKRKLDQILTLEDEVKQVRQRKEDLQQQRDHLFAERKRVSTKFNTLHRHIFQYLRDADGNPCSPTEYSLQQAADGSIYLLPRDCSGNKNDSNIIHHNNVGNNTNNATLMSLSNSSDNSSSDLLASSQNQRSTLQAHHSQQQHALAHNHIQQQQQQHEHQRHHNQHQHGPVSSIVTTTTTLASRESNGHTASNNINSTTHHRHQPHKD